MGQEEAQTIRTQPGVGVSTVARDGAWGATQPGIQEGAGGVVRGAAPLLRRALLFSPELLPVVQ